MLAAVAPAFFGMNVAHGLPDTPAVFWSITGGMLGVKGLWIEREGAIHTMFGDEVTRYPLAVYVFPSCNFPSCLDDLADGK